MRNRSVIRQFVFIGVRIFKKRMYKTRFELIRENSRSKRKNNESSYSGNKSRSTIFGRVGQKYNFLVE